jgi:peptide/nickel transport system permease protein
MTGWFTKIARQIGTLAVTVLLGGILSAALVRTSPGFGSDERLLDPRLDAASRSAIQAQLEADRNLPHFYFRHLRGILRGDFGTSISLDRPISELLRSRLPVSLRSIAFGLAGGWMIALTLALISVLWPGSGSRVAGTLSVIFLCLPSAAIAILIFAWGGPVNAIFSVVLFPKLFDYLRNLLRDAYARPHILAAKARGLSTARTLFWHAMPVCAPQLLTLAGVSASMAFGVSIPIETLCDLPGIGQLAWKAAIARDLPVLVTLTMLLAMATQLCNAISDLAVARLQGAKA